MDKNLTPRLEHVRELPDDYAMVVGGGYAPRDPGAFAERAGVVTIGVRRDLAEKLIDDAEILIHEDQIDGVPEGVLYDTVADRWTWEIDEALGWAVERLAEIDR